MHASFAVKVTKTLEVVTNQKRRLGCSVFKAPPTLFVWDSNIIKALISGTVCPTSLVAFVSGCLKAAGIGKKKEMLKKMDVIPV